MRHGIAGNKLNRNQKWRQATVRDLARATLVRERIMTTKAKAKEARKLVEKLITLGKKGTLAHKRRAFAVLCDHKLVSNLFNDISPRFKDRQGGYTRIINVGNRRGDNAQLSYLELTEKSEVIISKPKSAATKKKQDKASVAKSEEAKVDTSKAADKPKEAKEKEAKAKKKDTVKTDKKSNKVQDKKVLGGIRKMFKRKAGGGE